MSRCFDPLDCVCDIRVPCDIHRCLIVHKDLQRKHVDTHKLILHVATFIQYLLHIYISALRGPRI